MAALHENTVRNKLIDLEYRKVSLADKLLLRKVQEGKLTTGKLTYGKAS